MESIQYYNKESKIEHFDFPVSAHELKQQFPNYKIKLATNSQSIMTYFEDKELNVFDVNALIRSTNHLSSMEHKKLLGILQTYKPQSVNAVINVIRNLDNFLLITDYEAYHNTENLGKKIYEHRNPNPLNRKSLSSEEYIKMGIDAKIYQHIYTSRYGWIIEEKPIEIVQVSSEVYHHEIGNNKKVLNVTLTNPRTLVYTKLSLPVHEETLHQLLGRIESDNIDDCFVYYRANEIDTNLLHEMNYIFHSVALDDLNQITDEIQYFDTDKSTHLASVLSIVKPEDARSFYYLLDNLASFEPLNIDLDKPEEYALYKLNQLTNGTFDNIQKIIGNNINYEQLGQNLIIEDNVVQTQYGVLKVDKNFEHFLDKELQLEPQF